MRCSDPDSGTVRDNPDFSNWLTEGFVNGWISPPACYSHHGVPLTLDEREALDRGEEPCIYLLRVFQSRDERRDVMLNHETSAIISMEYALQSEDSNGECPPSGKA